MSSSVTRVVITEQLAIPLRELTLEAVGSGGPGGQNVNRVRTKVCLRFSIAESPSLADETRKRLLERLGHRLTKAGELVLFASAERERRRNEDEVLARFAALLRGALARRRTRKPTRPTRGSKERRLSDKRLRAERKRERRKGAENE